MPPGNCLEELSGDRAGQYSVRINYQVTEGESSFTPKTRANSVGLTQRCLQRPTTANRQVDRPAPFGNDAYRY
ncbi:hypothetical protein BKE56_001675 [Rhodococcus sp. M8]|nr:hypothetical protein BKE56_001675 [Rhodococcus sp. M8]